MAALQVTSRFMVGMLAGLWLPAAAHANEEFFRVRNYHPFAQVFGLPGFADASVLDPRQTSIAFNTTVINHSDVGARDEELIVLDGETYISNLVAGFGLSERLMLRAEVPLVAYNGGIFDGAIEWWHDLWGFPNGFRDGPNNELFMNYRVGGRNEFVLDASGSGPGDVRLEAAYRLAGGRDAGFGMVARAGVKLPTGDADRLRGSGATDYSLDLAIRKEFALPLGEAVLLANGGVLLLGSGDVLPQLQRDTVGFAGAGLLWRVNERWRLNVQLYGQTSYFDSELKQLGSDSISLTAGGSYTWVAKKLRLSVGLVEDLATDLTPDVALQIELTKDFN